jgi:hypothetical protein
MSPTRAARLFLILPLVIILAGPSPSSAEGTADKMARAMARMMEAMGLFGDESVGGSLSFGSSPYQMPGMSQMPWTQNPWSSPFTDPSRAFGMDQWMQQIPGLRGLTGTSLDGVWEGRDGGLLIIQRHRFRIQSARGGHVEGLIQQRGNRLAFYEPESEATRPYEFIEEQGRLILRDPEGQIFLYRRLWLEDDPYGAQ